MNLYDNSPYLTTDATGQPALDLRIRDVPPHEDATRLTGQHANGQPDGVHTGGPFRWQNEIWKPLDGRPYANYSFHYPTRELDALTALAGFAFVPKHWRHEYRNGRHWIVRPYAHLVGGPKLDWTWLTLDKVLALEQAILAIGRAGWELHEEPSLAFNPAPKWYDLYQIDFSNATNSCGNVRYNDDHDRFLTWLPYAGHQRLATLRGTGKQVMMDIWIKDIKAEHMRWRHVYASFYRPLDYCWLRMDQPYHLVDCPQPSWQHTHPHTWLLTETPLPPETVTRFELEHAWSVIE